VKVPPIRYVLPNNNELGTISKEKRTDGKTMGSASLHHPDFYKYAQIGGALGVRVAEPSKIDQALDQIINHDGPAMLEIMTDPELM
jgi:thiamine pyrophosphate-dependent acetolactate synthase large subunit-like protein